MQDNGGRQDGGYDPAGYGRGSQTPANSIGDFFGGRLRSRTAMLAVPGQEYLLFRSPDPLLGGGGGGFGGVTPVTNSGAALSITDLDQRDYFRGVIVSDPSLTGRILVPGQNGQAEGANVNLIDTGRRIFGDVVVHRAEGLVGAGDTGAFPGGVISVDDAGPFTVETIDLLPGVHPGPLGDFLGRIAENASFTEDFNGNGVLDPGEDLNLNGVIDISPLIDEAEVFGLYRQIIIPSPGDIVGRLKIAENNSPVPRDRLIFDYTFFENVGLHPNGMDVQRFVPGFEKTLWGGIASFDVRVPFATTLDSTIYTSDTLTDRLPGLTNTNSLELGDVSVAGKILLGQNDYWAFSAGAQVTFPTAEDVRIHLTDQLQTELIRIENKSIHVMPFLAMQHTPNERAFVHYYLQYDTDTRGNPLSYRGTQVAKPKDVDFLYADISMGYWLYSKAPRVNVMRQGQMINTRSMGSRGLTGFAPRLELHYNRALESTSSTPFGNEIIPGNAVDDLESLNLTLGATMMFGSDRELTFAWGAPILNRGDSDFDNELRVSFNWKLPQ